jgi:hypothetical protein
MRLAFPFIIIIVITYSTHRHGMGKGVHGAQALGFPA